VLPLQTVIFRRGNPLWLPWGVGGIEIEEGAWHLLAQIVYYIGTTYPLPRLNELLQHAKIANYRSIDVLELNDIKKFSVFAGSNGSGKSNFFKALDFVNLVIRFGADEALKQHGGFENIRCWRRTEARTFEFEIYFSTENADCNRYQLKIHQLDQTPSLEEKLQWIDEQGKMWKTHYR